METWIYKFDFILLSNNVMLRQQGLLLNKNVEYWLQDKWIGCFPIKWHIVKDVPNNLLKHIILENNENKPFTNSRDTQEVICYLTEWQLYLIIDSYTVHLYFCGCKKKSKQISFHILKLKKFPFHVKLEQGLQMLKIFKDHSSKQCILVDFEFYEDRQKRILEKKAKQQQFQKQVFY